MDREFDEAEPSGETDEVTFSYGFDDASPGMASRARWFARAGRSDLYRGRAPGVDYVQAWRDARAAELVLLAVCERHIQPLGLWVRTEKLITKFGVGVVRCELPAAGIVVLTELLHDGERFRTLVG